MLLHCDHAIHVCGLLCPRHCPLPLQVQLVEKMLLLLLQPLGIRHLQLLCVLRHILLQLLVVRQCLLLLLLG